MDFYTPGDFVSDVTGNDTLAGWEDSAADSLSDTWESIQDNTTEFFDDPQAWVQQQWDDLKEDIQQEWDAFKEEFDWKGFGVALIATSLGVPAPFAMLGTFGLDTYGQAFDIMKGDYNDDIEELEALQKELEALGDVYDGLYDDLLDLYMFWDEIYIMSASNSLDRYYKDVVSPKEEALRKKIDDFNNNYGDIIKLNADSVLGKFILSGTMIIGGVVTDIGMIFDGDLDASERGKAALRIIALIVAIVVLVFSWGSNVAAWKVIVAYVAFAISLDAGYGANGIMSGLLTMLDLVINDILKLDKILDSEKLGGLDKDSDYHTEMVELHVIIVQLVAVGVSLTGSWGGGVGAGSKVPEAIRGSIQVTGTLQQLYQTYNLAMEVYDFVTANDALSAAQQKIQDGIEATNARIDKLRRTRMLMQMQDMRYIQEDADEIINNFVLNVSESRAEYLDPAGTIRMNTRYKQEPMVQYGFEELFSSANMAGNDEYYKNILYST